VQDALGVKIVFALRCNGLQIARVAVQARAQISLVKKRGQWFGKCFHDANSLNVDGSLFSVSLSAAYCEKSIVSFKILLPCSRGRAGLAPFDLAQSGWNFHSHNEYCNAELVGLVWGGRNAYTGSNFNWGRRHQVFLEMAASGARTGFWAGRTAQRGHGALVAEKR
jgi:hypothetical protein